MEFQVRRTPTKQYTCQLYFHHWSACGIVRKTYRSMFMLIPLDLNFDEPILKNNAKINCIVKSLRDVVRANLERYKHAPKALTSSGHRTFYHIFAMYDLIPNPGLAPIWTSMTSFQPTPCNEVTKTTPETFSGHWDIDDYESVKPTKPVLELMQGNYSDPSFNRSTSVAAVTRYVGSKQNEHRSGPCLNRSSSNFAQLVSEHCRNIILTAVLMGVHHLFCSLRNARQSIWPQFQ